MSSSEGGDPPKPPAPGQPPSTLAGVRPPGERPSSPRAGLPPPRGPAGPSQAPPMGAPYASPQGPHAPAPPYAPPANAPAPHAAPPSQQPPDAQPPSQQPPGGYVPAPQYAQQPPQPQAPPAQSPAQASHVQPQFPPSQYAQQPIPQAQLVQSESSPIEQLGEVLERVPGKFVGFLKISAKRAFRLRIEPTEVLPDERAALAAANPPIHDPNLQAFLSWRRSVVFLVATMLTVLSIMGLIDSFIGKAAGPVRFVKLLPTLAEVAFCLICWLSLRNWTEWRKQRRWLLFGWLLFMLMPFAVFVYPLKLAVEGATKAMTVEQIRELGWYGVYSKALAPFAFAMIAMLQLAPKVISLMPGLIRSAMVVKLLFPGSVAPGWLIVLCAPLYAMIAYALLVIPYQFTAQPWFMFGVVLIMIAQVLVMRAGFALAKPLTEAEALKHIKRIRLFYMVLLITAAGAIIGGLGLLVKLMGMKWTTVITTLLKFETNVMILTTIGSDLVITNLDRARGYTEGKEEIERETEIKVASFVGLNAPPTPPPSGPARP